MKKLSLTLYALLLISASLTQASEAPYVRGIWLPGDDQPRCAALLIAPKIVLTAAHCVWDRGEQAAVDAESLTIRLDGKRPEGVPETASAKKILLNPEYGNGANAANDLALIELDTAPQGSLGGQQVERAISPPTSGARIFTFGYGGNEFRQVAVNQVTRVDRGMIRFRRDLTDQKSRMPATTNVQKQPSITLNRDQVQPLAPKVGDSGGPIFGEDGKLVGVSLLIQHSQLSVPGGARGFLKVLTLGGSERKEDSLRFISVNSTAAQELFSYATASGWDLPVSFRK